MTVALKESTFVFPGGGSGLARSVTINWALLPGLPSAAVEGLPLQDAKEKATANNPQTAIFLRFQEPIDRIALQKTPTKTSLMVIVTFASRPDY
jgi:hypothetical protein